MPMHKQTCNYHHNHHMHAKSQLENYNDWLLTRNKDTTWLENKNEILHQPINEFCDFCDNVVCQMFKNDKGNVIISDPNNSNTPK